MYQDPNMLASIRKVEAAREENIKLDPRRMTADEKDALLKKFHPDYRTEQFTELRFGPNKGQKVPLELADLLEGESRVLHEQFDLTKPDYETDVLIIGGGGAGCSAAIEADKAGAKVMVVTKLRMGDANTMMAEGGIQAADKPNDSPAIHFLDAFGGKADAPAKEHVELETGFAAEAQERGDVELFEKGDHGVGRVHPEGIGAGAFGLRWVDLIHASLLLLREWEGIIREKGRKCQGAEGK